MVMVVVVKFLPGCGSAVAARCCGHQWLTDRRGSGVDVLRVVTSGL